MSERRISKVGVVLVLYAAMAIYTWGHFWNHTQENRRAAELAAPFVSVFWPLYWSVTLQERGTFCNNQSSG